MKGDDRSISFSFTGNVPDHSVHFSQESFEMIDTDSDWEVRLVQDREHWYYVLDLRLRDEFGDSSDDVQSTLSIGVSHRSIQPVLVSLFTRVLLERRGQEITRLE